MKRYRILINGFLGFLALLGVLFYAIPGRPTISEKENRALAAKPKISFENFWSGKLTSDYTTYFSDNFPFRDQLISAANTLKTYTGTSGKDDIQIVYTDSSDDEAVSEDFDDDIYAEDPAQEDNRQQDENKKDIKEEEIIPDVALDDGVTRNGLIVSGDTALSIPGQTKKTIKIYAGMINDFADMYPDINVYCGVIPISSAFYLPKDFRSEKNDQRLMINNIYEMLDSNVAKLDLYSNLERHADEYIYLRTDHHWTGLGAYYAYEVFAKAIRQDPTLLSRYSPYTYENCLGTLYNKLGGNRAMRENPDYITVYQIPFQYEAHYWRGTRSDDYYVRPLVATNIRSWNKYLAFTYGDHGVIDITTPVKNGRKLIMFKDSFGNAFVPFLVSHFEKIYVIDPRYPTPSIKGIIEDEHITDVLYLTNIGNTNVGYHVKALKRISSH